MKAHVLKGSKREIAEKVKKLDGDVREAIVFIAEASDIASGPTDGNSEPQTVDVKEFDDSRESIYTRQGGE
jgi:hypothetical protein